MSKQKDFVPGGLGYVANGAGGLVVLLGSVVILGWFTNSTLLVQLQPQWVPMQFNTALGFVLCGAGLLFLNFRQRQMAAACGGLALGLGLLTLLQYLFDLDFGIDRLFLDPGITTNTIYPGRMAQATALSHLLSGLGLVLSCLRLPPKRQAMIYGLLGIIIAAIGIGTLFGYLLGRETPFAWSHLTYMAVHTAAGFFVLGIGIFAFGLRGTWVKGRWPKWIPTIVGIGFATLALSLWQALLALEQQQARHVVARQVAVLENDISIIMSQQILALEHMARRWEQQGGIPYAFWTADAAHYIEHNLGLQALSWLDACLHVRWTEPLQGNQAAKDLYLPFEPRRAQALETARLKRVATATRNIELVQGGKAIIVYIPLYIDDRFDGFIGGVFRIDKLLAPMITGLAKEDFGLALFEGNEEVYRRVEPGTVYEPSLSQDQMFGIANLDWRLHLQPSQALLAKLSSPLPLIALIVGLLLALLMALSIHFSQAVKRRADTLVTLNRELAAENKKRKKTEQSLKESELWQRGIFDAIEEGVMVTTPEGVIASMNPACRAILGYSQAEIAGQPTALVHVDQDHAVAFSELIKAAFDKGGAARFEFELKRKNGEVFSSEHTVSLITDAQGEAVGLVSTLTDITARKQTEAELRRHREHLQELVANQTRDLMEVNVRLHQEIGEHQHTEETLAEREQYLQAIFDNMQEGVIVTTEVGMIESANPAALAMFGYDAEQLLGKDEIILMQAPDRNLHTRALKRYLEEDADHQTKGVVGGGHREVAAVRADGTIFQMSLALDEMWLAGQRRFIAILRDISEQNRARQALEDSRKQMRELAVHLQTARETERVRIARDVHDELGQVLTALNMDAHWMSKHIPDEQVELQQKNLSMLSVINIAIGSVQRITSELRPAMLDELGLGPAIQWYLDEFQQRTGIECESVVDFDDMQLDPGRATTVFRILQEALTNVTRHAGASRISLGIRRGDGHLEMRLSDNGRGVTPSEINREDAFGLLGMKERALASGGKVEIEGQRNEGTTVSLHLPLDSHSAGV